MPERRNAERTAWLEEWRACREALVRMLRSMGYLPGDHHGTRRDDAETYPHISILRERTVTWWEQVAGLPTADWIGTVYFPIRTDQKIMIEVFGRRNLPDARRVAWAMRQEYDLDIDARLAHPRERTEEEDVPHISNAENWGQTFG